MTFYFTTVCKTHFGKRILEEYVNKRAQKAHQMVVNSMVHFVKLCVVCFSCIAFSPYTLKIRWYVLGVRESIISFW